MPSLTGYAVVYNSPAEISLGGGLGFREVVVPGALDNVLARRPDVVYLRDHHPSLLLGRTTSGTLTLADGPIGLRATVSVPPTELGHESFVLAKRGDLKGMSFAFVTKRDRWVDGPDGRPTRFLEELEQLYDVSACSMPAYSATSLDVASRPPPTGVGATRARRLELLARQIQLENEEFAHRLKLGRPIPRPAWAPRRGIRERHGCGHGIEV